MNLEHCRAKFGIDIVKEIEDTLVKELSKSIDTEILRKLYKLGPNRKERIRNILEKIKSSE